jgi:hypothetical protein
MANPIYRISKKLKQHPWLKTPADRIVVVTGLLIGLIVIMLMIGDYRTQAISSDCIAKGGTLVYKKQFERLVSQTGLISNGQEYQTIDHCDFSQQKN